MVQFMKSGNFRPEPGTTPSRDKVPVKVEIEDSLEEEHGPYIKRSKPTPNFQQACLLPAPKRSSSANYASCGLGFHWRNLRMMLRVGTLIRSSLPSTNSLGRWFGEPVRAALVHTNSFLTNARGYPCLSKRHQKLVTAFFNHSIQIVISGKPVHSLVIRNSESAANHAAVNYTDGHLLRPYLDYVGYLYQRMNPLPDQEHFESLMLAWLSGLLTVPTATSHG